MPLRLGSARWTTSAAAWAVAPACAGVGGDAVDVVVVGAGVLDDVVAPGVAAAEGVVVGETDGCAVTVAVTVAVGVLGLGVGEGFPAAPMA